MRVIELLMEKMENAALAAVSANKQGLLSPALLLLSVIMNQLSGGNKQGTPLSCA